MNVAGKTAVPEMFSRDAFYREVGRRIRSAREKQNFTQEGLAFSIGLSRASLANIEKGRQKALLHNLAEIASVLGINTTELVPNSMRVFDFSSVRLKSSEPAERIFVEQVLNRSAV